MATIQNYLKGVVRYYDLAPAGERSRYEHIAPREYGSRGFNLVPAFGYGGGGYGYGGNNGMNVNVMGGTDVMRQARHFQQEDRNNDRASSAAFLGGILTVGIAAGLAYVAKNWSNTNGRLEEARQFKEEQIPLIENTQQRAELLGIVNKDIKILEKTAFRNRNFVILTGFALATAATAFAAGMLGVQWLITASIVAGVATAAVGAFAAVWYAMEKAEAPEGVIEFLNSNPGIV